MIVNFLERIKKIDSIGNFRFMVRATPLNKREILEKKVNEVRVIKPNCLINVREIFNIQGGGGKKINIEVNIQFITKKQSYNNLSSSENLSGLLKLCLLKEISSKYTDNKIRELSENLSWIIEILKNGYIFIGDPKEGIAKILNKLNGCNIINFSKYVDETINFNEVNNLISRLDQNSINEIENIKNCLSKYNEHIKFFEKEIDRAKKNSIFEYSIISLAIIDREDFELYSNERKNCPNRVDRILFHGTGISPISSILTGNFWQSKSGVHGAGVYFTEDLDYSWYYGGKENRENFNIIPKINDCFSLIASSIYYNKDGFKRVYDSSYTPKKNEINFGYAECRWGATIKEQTPDMTKFIGTEYVIDELNQICPFVAARLKRDEYCVIWRDNNFSSKPVYNNEFDKIFKSFLNERLKYIEQTSKFNIYPCETSEEALKLIRRKKYNKIILISNIGTDLGGKKFITEARSIIGNDVITLFLAYNTNHLNWVKDFKNSLFSNEANFYEEFLDCFYGKNEDDTYKSINELKKKIEQKFNTQFYFDSTFLYYPNFKNSGYFTDLSFN